MIKKALSLLGHQATDKITGFTGIVTTVGFDLYGCVQVILTPKMRDEKLPDAGWFDVKRLDVDALQPMIPRSFDVAFGSERGGSEKPPFPNRPVQMK